MGRMTNIEIMGLESSIVASGYPMRVGEDVNLRDIEESDFKRAVNLSKLGNAHEQFLTGIRVNFDLTFSNKAWVEAERYRFLEFVSSQSTMHRVCRMDIREQCNKYVDADIINILKKKIADYNYWKNIEELRNKPLSSLSHSLPSMDNDINWKNNNQKEYKAYMKDLYLEILYNLPSGLELTARMTTNYRCLKNIYNQRKDHRLPEWREFCKEIKNLPHFTEICLGGEE